MLLDGKNFLLLGGNEHVDGFHLGVSHLLDFVLTFLLDVLGEFSGLFGLLQGVNAFATYISHSNLGVFTSRLGFLDEVLAPLLGERGEWGNG